MRNAIIEKSSHFFSKPLDASAPKAQMSIISNYATSPKGLDKESTAHIISQIRRFADSQIARTLPKSLNTI